jgi:hypothetical protein
VFGGSERASFIVEDVERVLGLGDETMNMLKVYFDCLILSPIFRIYVVCILQASLASLVDIIVSQA